MTDVGIQIRVLVLRAPAPKGPFFAVFGRRLAAECGAVRCEKGTTGLLEYVAPCQRHPHAA